MIPLQKVLVEWNRCNRAWYIDRGYKFSDYGEMFEVEAKDLQPTSKKAEFKVICDYCGDEYITTPYKYYRAKASSNLKTDCCGKKDCKSAKVIQSNEKKYGNKSPCQKKTIIVKDENGNDVEGQECARCGYPLPLSEFWSDPNTSTGRSSWCIRCMKRYRKSNKQKNKVKKYQKEYYVSNKNEISEYKKKWWKEKNKTTEDD